MNDKLINEICNILNITYHHHKHFTDGVSSKVILINDYYLVKENTIEELKGEIEYLNLNKSDLIEQADAVRTVKALKEEGKEEDDDHSDDWGMGWQPI